ncbi:MAG: hypothetical protein LBU67_01780 [Oscillospiraceae bacterium]|jgi:hypothetical protein|nr:hypothetical protein [Oscillospiraceae bacterium]
MKLGRHGIWIRLIEVMVAIPIIALLILMLLGLYQQQKDINKLQGDVDSIKRITADVPADQLTVDFLKSEAETHRLFIEDQRNQLLWLVGLLAGAGGLLLTFFGFASRKDIQDNIEEALKEHISKTLHDDKALENLQRSVRREKQAGEIRVLFARHYDADTDTDEYRDFVDTYEFFRKRDYAVSDRIIPLNAQNYEEETKTYKILVYIVPENERESQSTSESTNSSNQEPLYPQLSKMSKDKKMQCILYVPIPGRIKPQPSSDAFVSMVNLHAKLRETLYMLLYFSSLNY